MEYAARKTEINHRETVAPTFSKDKQLLMGTIQLRNERSRNVKLINATLIGRGTTLFSIQMGREKQRNENIAFFRICFPFEKSDKDFSTVVAKIKNTHRRCKNQCPAYCCKKNALRTQKNLTCTTLKSNKHDFAK